jgi:hypothetical protein
MRLSPLRRALHGGDDGHGDEEEVEIDIPEGPMPSAPPGPKPSRRRYKWHDAERLKGSPGGHGIYIEDSLTGVCFELDHRYHGPRSRRQFARHDAAVMSSFRRCRRERPSLHLSYRPRRRFGPLMNDFLGGLIFFTILFLLTALGHWIWHRIKNPSPLAVDFKNFVVWVLGWIYLILTPWWAVPSAQLGRYYGGIFVLILLTYAVYAVCRFFGYSGR